jgi:hypothetical protein
MSRATPGRSLDPVGVTGSTERCGCACGCRRRVPHYAGAAQAVRCGDCQAGVHPVYPPIYSEAVLIQIARDEAAADG